LLTAVAAALSGGSQPELPGFLNSLSGPLGHYGLWAIALLVLVEDFGIPVPGETVLIAGAIYAGSGRLNVVAVGLVGFAAAVFGDNIGYAIGRFGGRSLVERWGKYVFITPERLDKAEAFFDHHGGKVITIARFVEGLRQANGLIAGITKMHWLRFVAFNALGAALWVGTWVSVGYFAGQHITTIYNDITSYSLYAAIVAVVVIAGLVFLRVRRHRREKAAKLGAQAAARDDSPADVRAPDAEPGEGSRPQAQAPQADPGQASTAEAQARDGAAGEVPPAGAREPEPQSHDAGQTEEEAPDEVRTAGASQHHRAEPGREGQAASAGSQAAPGTSEPAPRPLSNGLDNQTGTRDGEPETRPQESDRS
jgi:membrane protein DedA with SNARE-associated domain